MIYKAKRKKIIAIMAMAIAGLNPILTAAVPTPIEQTEFSLDQYSSKVYESFGDISDNYLKQKLDPKHFPDCKVIVIQYLGSVYGLKLQSAPELKIVVYKEKSLFINTNNYDELMLCS